MESLNTVLPVVVCSLFYSSNPTTAITNGLVSVLAAMELVSQNKPSADTCQDSAFECFVLHSNDPAHDRVKRFDLRMRQTQTNQQIVCIKLKRSLGLLVINCG